MTIGRLSQAAVEVVLQAAPKVRLCQQAGELLLQGTPRARLGQHRPSRCCKHSDKHCKCAAAGDAPVD